MTCSFDLKEYALGESSRDAADRIEAHAAECCVCRDELARLQITRSALLALRDEEPPRRIAFVSDKIFEPRWYHRVWNSGPRLAFLGAAMLACAILVHAFHPQTVAPPVPVTLVDNNAIEGAVSARLKEAVITAVADSEARQRKQTAQLLRAAEQRLEIDRRATIAAFSEQTRLLQKQVANMYVTANNLKAGE